jgi:hypothetical protein
MYKPKGIEMPSQDVLESCFYSNPDGAGYMYPKDGSVQIKKGFMKFEDLYESLMKDYSKDLDMVVHFRIGTQGANSPELTHPYMISKKMDDLKQTSVTAKMGVVHNGIISLTSSHSIYETVKVWSEEEKLYKYIAKKIDYNDTMKFITDYLSLIIKSPMFYKDEDKIELIEKLAGYSNKFAIMDNTGHTTLIGTFYEDYGCKFSNSSYKAYLGSSYYSNKNDKFSSSYDELFDDFENSYNEDTGLYEFEENNCPLTQLGECGYCSVCHLYGTSRCNNWKL